MYRGPSEDCDPELGKVWDRKAWTIRCPKPICDGFILMNEVHSDYCPPGSHLRRIVWEGACADCTVVAHLIHDIMAVVHERLANFEYEAPEPADNLIPCPWPPCERRMLIEEHDKRMDFKMSDGGISVVRKMVCTCGTTVKTAEMEE